MATPFYDNIFVESAKLIDAKWGPFTSDVAAYAAVPIPARQIGMFAIIAPPGGTASLYWYKDNTTTLVPFSGNSSVEIYPAFINFPATGSLNVIYIDKSESKSYYWNNTSSVYELTDSNVEVYNNSTLFPQIGVENVIYIADDTNTSYVWNSALFNGNGDYEILTGAGKGITSIARTSGDGSPGTTDTYTVTYSDTTTYEFFIYNGADGIDGTDGSPGLVYLGNYILGNGYIANIAVVKGSDNNLYIAKASGGLADPVGNTAEWDIFLPKGVDGTDGIDGIDGIDGVDALWNFTQAYSGGAAYAVGDIATYDGETWYRINSNGGNVGDTPAEGTFWTKIAAKGADGSGGGVAYYVDAGSADAYVITTGNSLTTNTEGDTYLIKFTNVNTGLSTLTVDSATAAPLIDSKTQADLAAGDIADDSVHLVVYTAANKFEIVTIGGGGTGDGDMTKAIYDEDQDGVVDSAERVMFQAKNGYGTTLTKGTIVYLAASSSSGLYPEVLKANASTEAGSSKTIGAVYEDIPAGQIGYIVTSGRVHNLNTAAYSVGAKLWLATTDGEVTTTPPTQPDHTVFIGTVTRSQSSNGGILYAIQNGYEIQELHNVLITGTRSFGEYLYYDEPNNLWKNNTSWQGDTIAVTKGGTGLTSYTAGDFLYASDVDVINTVSMAETGNVILSNDTTFAPSWGKVGLTTHITGILNATNGGTGISSYTIGDLLYANTTTGLNKLQAVAAGSVLISNGIGTAPSWSNSPKLISILFSNATNNNTITLNTGATAANYTLTLPTVAPAANQYMQFSAAGVASWVNGTVVGVTTVGSFSGTAQTNGASISGSTITFGPASDSVPGMVSIGAQSFNGTKTFIGFAGPIQFNNESLGSYTLPAASATPSNGTRIVIAPGAVGNTPLSFGWNTNYEFWMAGRSVLSFYPNNVTTRVADFRFIAGTTNTNTGLKGLSLATGFVAFDPVIDVGGGWIKCVTYNTNIAGAPVIGTRSSGTRIALVVSGDGTSTLDTALGNMQEGGFGTNYTSMWLTAARDIVFYTNNTSTERFRINSTGLSYAGTKILGARVTGWGAPTGTLNRAALTLTAAATYSQTDFNTVIQTLKAVITDLRAHGLINN